jgi:hypothetical protein
VVVKGDDADAEGTLADVALVEVALVAGRGDPSEDAAQCRAPREGEEKEDSAVAEELSFPVTSTSFCRRACFN